MDIFEFFNHSHNRTFVIGPAFFCHESPEVREAWTKARNNFRGGADKAWAPLKEVNTVIDALQEAGADETTTGCIAIKVASEAGVESLCEGYAVGVQGLVDHGQDEEAAEKTVNEGAKKLWSWYNDVNTIC